MESDMDINSSSGGPAGSRWTPTKDQIDLLENFYRQGVRTPSAEQIQHITSKLRAFGHIEGKNVFYWFQNHKARQRQKQKQENVALINRFMLHQTPPPAPHFPTDYLNVSCHTSFYMPRPPSRDLSIRPNHQRLLVPGYYRKIPLQPETISNTLYTKPCNALFHEPALYEEQIFPMQNNVNGDLLFQRNQETLDLFPLHPTGNLQEKRANISIPSSSTSTSASSDTNYINGSGNSRHVQPFIDFFCLDGRCNSS